MTCLGMLLRRQNLENGGTEIYYEEKSRDLDTYK